MSKSKELKELQEIWYKKLKDSGFNDLEYSDGSLTSSQPKVLRGRDLTEANITAAKATREYYYMATHFLNDYKFDSELHKTMWEYHAEGISVRDIAKILNETGLVKTDKSTVGRILKDLEAKMKFLYLTI